jgi:ribonuclease Z
VSLRAFVALGTQSQAPTKARNHHGGLLRWDGLGFLFDPGEGTQRQFAYAGIAASAVTHICITHFHGDHCLGLAGMVQRLSMDRCPHPVRAHFPASGQVFFDRLRHAAIFTEVTPLVPCPIVDEGQVDAGPGWTLGVRRLDHRTETFGYRLEEEGTVTCDPRKLEEAGVRGPDVGVLVRDGQVVVGGRLVRREEVGVPRPGQVVAFVLDTRPCQGAVELARGADLAVMESTFATEHAEEAAEYGHMTAAQAGRVAAEAGVKTLALTHFSQRYEDVTPLLEEARAEFPGTVVALSDLDVLELPRRKRGA